MPNFASLSHYLLAAFCALTPKLYPAHAQQPPPPKPAVMEKMHGVWIEGPGFDIKYGLSYEACAARCVENKACLMLEYYRPQRKCNLYSTERPQLKGGASDVAVRR